MGKKKKCDYNCHTNFKLKSDAQNGNCLKSHSPFAGQLANGSAGETRCQSDANKMNNKINFAKENEPISSVRLSDKASGSTNKETTSLFNLIFRSLTSSSSNSNPSDNASQQNSGSNEKSNFSPHNRTADREQNERNPANGNNKSFDLKETQLNLSLSSLQASPQKLAIAIKNLPEN